MLILQNDATLTIMSHNVISVLGASTPAGLSPSQFKRIDGLFCLSASAKILTYRAVDCDFDAGRMTISLSKSEQLAPHLSFVSQKIGPKATMYELYKFGKGRIEKSALFERVFERMHLEVNALLSEKRT